MRFFEIATPKRVVKATKRFLKEYATFARAWTNLTGRFDGFLDHYVGNHPGQYNNKDYRFSVGPATGWWHCHLIFGKAIVVYDVSLMELRLASMVDHSAVDGTTHTHANLGKYLQALTGADFMPFGEPEIPDLSTEQVHELRNVLYEIAAEDPDVLRDFVAGTDTTAMDFLLLALEEPWDDATKQEAIENAFGGPEGLRVEVRTVLKQMHLTEAHMLAERVYGRYATGYHRTKSIQRVKAIGESGFRAGTGDTYGAGIYLTYDFDDQQDERMKSLYGPFIVRSRVSLDGFLIFDEDVAKMVYPDAPGVRDQFARFGLKFNYDLLPNPFNGFTSSQAKWFADLLPRLGAPIDLGIKGLVFTGAQDGRVVVAYDPDTVVPMSYARVLDLTKDEHQVKWNRFDLKASVAKRTPTMTRDTRGAIFRFMKRAGFTRLNDDFFGIYRANIGVVVGIGYGNDGRRLDIHITRQDPTSMVFNEGTFYPFLKSCLRIATIENETFDEKPSLILTAIQDAVRAVPVNYRRNLAFARDLFKMLVKPGAAIEERTKQVDYLRDTVAMTTTDGSIRMTLDEPYAAFTHGRVRVAVFWGRSHFDLDLVFNDGQNIGEHSSEHAYQKLLQWAMYPGRPRLPEAKLSDAASERFAQDILQHVSR